MYQSISIWDTKCSTGVVLRMLHPASHCFLSRPRLPSCFTDSVSHSDSDKSRKDPEQPTHCEKLIILKIWKKQGRRAFPPQSHNSITVQQLWLSIPSEVQPRMIQTNQFIIMHTMNLNYFGNDSIIYEENLEKPPS